MDQIYEGLRPAPSVWPNRIAWGLQLLAALAFAAAGTAKLLGIPHMVEVFAQVGLGQWFRYLTATIEIAGALSLLTRRTAFSGALVLACVMIGAIAAHLTRLHTSPGAAIFLLVVVATIAWLRRSERA